MSAGTALQHDGGPAARRRTQVQRSARTRRVLLDAAISTLVEIGAARLSTREVARRASVTNGALQHHFATKAQLVAAAVEELNRQLTAEVLASTPPDGGSERERAGQLLDQLWQLYQGSLMAAMAELMVAARTDAELRSHLMRVQRDAIAATAVAGAQLFPHAAPRTALAPLIDTALATLRGLALVGFADAAGAQRMWSATREHLLGLLFALERSPTAS